jgi:hypothetical protein
MRRIVLGSVIAAMVLIAAGLALGARTVLSSQPAGQLVVQGRVIGTDGKPVSGIKVWLNVWPAATVALGGGRVTVVGSAVTSATGRYALRVSSLSALAPDVTNGILKFNLMTGNSTGWDMASFSRGLSGGATMAVLHLMKPAL